MNYLPLRPTPPPPLLLLPPTPPLVPCPCPCPCPCCWRSRLPPASSGVSCTRSCVRRKNSRSSACASRSATSACVGRLCVSSVRYLWVCEGKGNRCHSSVKGIVSSVMCVYVRGRGIDVIHLLKGTTRSPPTKNVVSYLASGPGLLRRPAQRLELVHLPPLLLQQPVPRRGHRQKTRRRLRVRRRQQASTPHHPSTPHPSSHDTADSNKRAPHTIHPPHDNTDDARTFDSSTGAAAPLPPPPAAPR